jgi:tetratricopeptide (TPR) repeat protein
MARASGNTHLRSARQALGLRSQQALADAVTRAGRSMGLRISVNARTVRRWESEQPPWPQPEHQAALEGLFQRSVTELGFMPPWSGDSAPAHQERSAAVERGVAALGAGAGLASSVPLPARVAGPALQPSIARDFVTITAAHRRMYWTVPAKRLHEPVTAHANLGAVLLPAMPDGARPPLASALAESGMLAGRLAFFDLQQPDAAQSSYLLALQAAQEARDSLLASAVLGHMAFIPAFSGAPDRADEAREKVRAARAFARRGHAPPEMLAWLDAAEAEVETLFGNTRKALQLITHGEEIFENEEPRPSPPWLDWFSPIRLAGFKGNTLLAAGQPDRAREALQTVLDSYADDEASLKQRSITLADLAAVAVAQSDPEQACALAEMALDHLARYWYATGMDRVRAVRESLTRWEALPCVRRLDEHLYDWNTTVSILSG